MLCSEHFAILFWCYFRLMTTRFSAVILSNYWSRAPMYVHHHFLQVYWNENRMGYIISTLSQPHTINEETMLRTQDFLTNETRKYQCSMQSGSASFGKLIEKKLFLLKPTYYSSKKNKWRKKNKNVVKPFFYVYYIGSKE